MKDNKSNPTTSSDGELNESDDCNQLEQEQESDVDDDGDASDDHDEASDDHGDASDDHDEATNDANDDGSPGDEEKTATRNVHKLSMKKTQDFNETLKQRGVIYVARIPPRMTPTKLKTILSDYGEVTRVFCQEEDAAKRKRRRKESGSKNASKRYVEGWVEYASKQVAKRVAASLHQQSMSNVKRNPHYGDLWNLKYLSKFSWSHLTEKVAYERRVREQKLRLETMQAKRETASYKKLLETGVKLDKIEERKRKRGDATATGDKGRTFQLKPLDDGVFQVSNKAILKSLL